MYYILYHDIFSLPFMHTPPADKAVDIVEKKGGKADDHRKIGDIVCGGKQPHYYQHDVVCRISHGKILTAAECEIHGGKACCYRESARQQICRIEIRQYKVKHDRHGGSQQKHKSKFGTAYTVDGDLRVPSLVRIAKPRNERKQSHGSGHTEVCYHLSVIGKAKRDNSVKHAENYHQHLPRGISFCIKYKRCYTY